MDLTPRTIGISPDPDCLKGVAACQCTLGREKLLTAPPYKRVQSPDSLDTATRHLSASCSRETERFKCPTSQILVTFIAPLHPKEVFNKVFPSTTPIKFVKKKLATLISVSNSNILLVKNRTVLIDTCLLSEINTDSFGQVNIDVFTKDNSLFSLSNIPKDSYVQDLYTAIIPDKNAVQFVAIKFKVRNQNGIFTRSYHSIMKVHEVKKNLAALFQCEPDNLVILSDDKPLKDRMPLLDLDYDLYGNVEVELLTKNGIKLNLDKLYKEIPVNDILTVMVPLGKRTKQINVEVFSEPIRKPFLGGYRNVYSGYFLSFKNYSDSKFMNMVLGFPIVWVVLYHR